MTIIMPKHNEYNKSVNLTRKVGDCLVSATIPVSVLKHGLIPAVINTLINMPCTMNQVKLRLKYGVHVSYRFACSEGMNVEYREVA